MEVHFLFPAQDHADILKNFVLSLLRGTVIKADLYMRPMHFIKMIELRVDLYRLTGDEKLKEEILPLFFNCLETIRRFYYLKENYMLHYFEISEFYFMTYYYLKYVEGLDMKIEE